MKKEIVSSVAAAVLVVAGAAAVKHMSLEQFEMQLKNSRTEQDTVAAAADGNWGLSFREEGKTPVGNADAAYLQQFHAWYAGPEEAEKDRVIYLTFDAGYENGCTESILDVLKEEKVPAAFFLVGNYIEENPDLVKRMNAEGHIVGNHTMHHPDMSAIGEASDFEKELKDLEAIYEKVTGETLQKLYRPPQGKYSESNLKQASELGYTTVFWSLAYVDWYEDKQPSREEALNLLNRRIHPGAIVLLHSTSRTNAEIMSELIQGWKEQGYVFRSLEELTEYTEKRPAST